MTIVLLYMMLIQFEVVLLPALIITFAVGTFLPFGIAFSANVRCVVLLMFPSIFTGEHTLPLQ